MEELKLEGNLFFNFFEFNMVNDILIPDTDCFPLNCPKAKQYRNKYCILQDLKKVIKIMTLLKNLTPTNPQIENNTNSYIFLEDDAEIFEFSLYSAAIVLYAKCFTNNTKRGKLEKKQWIKEQDLLEFHEDLINQRR